MRPVNDGPPTAVSKWRKFARFVSIYGPRRSLFKAAGRLRIGLPSFTLRRMTPDVAIVGCGQFAFATIGYFLQRAFGPRIAACFDSDNKACASFASAMRVPLACTSADQLFDQSGLRVAYVASNHASHTPYAIQALRRGLDVYIEKPIAVTHDQLVELLVCKRDAAGRVFAGYNRPFSAAVRDLRRRVRIDPTGGMSLQCFVSGHQIGPDHWYRLPQEGTRVCGNIGHWLDLMVHVLSWRGMPDQVRISLAWARDDEPDDNLSIAIVTDRADVFSVMLTSRCEPFEGINETINFQHADTICKIDDFRRMTLWQGERLIRRRYWPKDVGHRLAVLQPFDHTGHRDWQEVVLSTLLMLHITQMVRDKVQASDFSFTESLAHLHRLIDNR